MPSNQTDLVVLAGALPPAVGPQTRQEFLNDIAAALIVRFPSSLSTFGIGSVVPTSDEGPFFQSLNTPSIEGIGGSVDTFMLKVWSVSVGDYIPIYLTQDQLRYWVGTSAPSPAEYLAWWKVNTDGRLLNISTYDRASEAWYEPFYTKEEIDMLFADLADPAGGIQVNWDNVSGKPENILTGNATDLPGSSIPVAFNYQEIFHLILNTKIIYNGSQWITADGVSGDLKWVSAGSLGVADDFNNGNFSTALGRNPGWLLSTAEQGRTLVSAKPGEVWNSLTTLEKNPGAIYGDADITLTEAQMPEHRHLAINDATVNDGAFPPPSSGSAIVRGNTGGGSGNYLLTTASGAANSGLSSPSGEDGKHNNIPPSICRWLLVKA